MPFSVKGNKEVIVTDTVLRVRRTIAQTITEESIKKLSRKPNPSEPDLALMQELWDCGVRKCPVSGMPTFNPSKLDERGQQDVWKLHCDLAEAINKRDINECTEIDVKARFNPIEMSADTVARCSSACLNCNGTIAFTTASFAAAQRACLSPIYT